MKARRDAKVVLQNSDCFGWNDVPLELRKDIERIHRNLGHASADQLGQEKWTRCEFLEDHLQESPRVKTTLKVLNIVDAASGMHIANQIADQTAETIWRAFATGWLGWAETEVTIETEANAKIRKSLIGRSRPMRGNYVPGDLVYYWRAGSGVHQAQGQWLGPARVIGIEGGNVWVSHRATAIKCAKEQLRMASPRRARNARDADENWRRRSR